MRTSIPILLNVTYNGWLPPREASEPLKLLYLRVRWGRLCGERRRSTNQQQNQKMLKMINATDRWRDIGSVREVTCAREYYAGLFFSFFFAKVTSDLIWNIKSSRVATN